MAQARSIVTGASLALALICASWAVYVSKHAPAGGDASSGQSRSGGAGGGNGNDAIPVLTAAAVLVRLTSPGPVLFHQSGGCCDGI